MQRAIILLATSDPQLEQIATDAILETSHGLRRIREYPDAVRILAGDTRDVALAIIDLDFDQPGPSLLKLLAESEPGFPVLVVADEADAVTRDDEIANVMADFLLKPISSGELAQTIRELCREFELICEESLPRLRGRHHSVALPYPLKT
ncbi:MAG TPA: hypothetical protein VIM61_05045 [Chthoniobacterales bacterium]|jgi:DNA-binding NarL/FixJ family response regulator